ncbi:tRNA-(ms[2]io[6]A)-hydroxylase [Spongiibacter sp. KMU-158]|uniref:tRNA-(Ms[2]io[6]A)-hydroxylase n=1 Tax=Spongiibacter pelagi TaxID=2760804 RepID=A0A927C0P7_9GAMM|nr:tRNA-(ms[2]io[6]A)-hydroxylase [Spongiibacter pelagi]MBD2859108.1 tRNA-(ms[2]io[6]A)-hydroxylase [Spongiibacter pelagi]
MSTDISEILDFLPCATPDAWIEAALAHPEDMLIDHANCEKKAAGTALNLMFRYVDKIDLLNKMSRLAREELRHFEQVLKIMKTRGIEYRQISSARYANGLRSLARSSDPGRLVDVLIIGAIIEARSCERFAALAPHLDEELAEFYRSLLKSESRHYQDYLKLARSYANEPIEERVALFLAKEQELIQQPDEAFRFHSGPLRAA